MYDYFTNKNKHRLIIKNKHKYMAIYYKNRYRNQKNKKPPQIKEGKVKLKL